MPDNRILTKMLDRLYASLARGPSINCLPHRSRQRVDLATFSAFEDGEPVEILRDLLGEREVATVGARVPMPASLVNQPRGFRGRVSEPSPTPSADELTERPPEELAAERAWKRQQKLLTKLRNLSEDARTYEQDTGVHALYLGYPILSLPPGVAGRTRRILAPIAFVPVSLEVRTGQRPGVVVRGQGDGVDRVQPNAALVAWLERETGEPIEELYDDPGGVDPYREIRELIEQVASRAALDSAAAAAFSTAETIAIRPIPLADDLPEGAALVPGAVLGLFPASNQGLVRDTQAMIAEPGLDGPVSAFIDVDANLTSQEMPEAGADSDLDQPATGSDGEARVGLAADGVSEAPPEYVPRRFVDERLVARADPFQARAVAQARSCPGLVIHGPPGTGKSQTITNIIGDHLARGERVLFVCDKRTALDVVANRLEHLGLKQLVAVVHDPKRDQRQLYMSIRASLDELPEAPTEPNAPRELARIDREMSELHEELTGAHQSLHDTGENGEPSFHDLMGTWLTIQAPVVPGLQDVPVPLDDLMKHRRDIDVILERAAESGYGTSPWTTAAGGTLDAFLALRADTIRRAIASTVEDARVADTTRDARIPPFVGTRPLVEQGTLRGDLTQTLADVRTLASSAVLGRAAQLDAAAVERLTKSLEEAAAIRAALEVPLERELSLVVATDRPPISRVNTDIADLRRYVASTTRWWGFLAFGAKGAGGRALASYGLALDVEAAERALNFLNGLRARQLLAATLAELRGETPEQTGLPPDERMVVELRHFQATLALLRKVDATQTLPAEIRAALVDDAAAEELLAGLAKSPERAEALDALERSSSGVQLFEPSWLGELHAGCRAGGECSPVLLALEQRFDDVESVLRIREGLGALPAALGVAIETVLAAGLSAEDGRQAIERGATEHEIVSRVERDERLRRIDGRRLTLALRRYAELEGLKRGAVRDAILHRWIFRQQDRLLASTGSRLNGDGAALRRRLFVRGKRAMRLRQMIAAGALGSADGRADGKGGSPADADPASTASDPLFDMCPVWMASPESVAQIFPREEVFDVVIFDEASQCRLEEALPVLTRARRAVIAGDPKQLPPSRFFETSISTSDDDELETDQDLFEAQQGEVEDLLAAALNIDVEESYLDVHYRSRNSDLIRFSNEQFYRSRLQAIPGHPKNRARLPPIRLDRVDGVYDERSNAAEAERVVQIVDDLLRRADPPSIGIACFNLKQRDVIRDVLDRRAQDDAAFASRLGAAREKRGDGSFEGLFVKNLESVQGDERDHLIVSTTYGPDPEGKFRQNFGPLNMSGGGRRLNVLVTRARQELHIVTSIPREKYAGLAPVPPGKSPNGRWLLYAYLRYAELLAAEYAEANEILDAAVREGGPRLVENPLPPPSAFANGVGTRLALDHAIGSDVHWGNVGFCVDAALHHPERLADVTAGVLTDFTRYPGAPDPIEWEVFRTSILEWQGWTLVRVWTPLYFRDAERQLGRVAAAAAEVLAED